MLWMISYDDYFHSLSLDDYVFHIDDGGCIPHICHRHHRRCLCKNFLSGVNFSRLSEKKCIYMTFSETFLVFLVPLVVFLGVKFGFRKSCQCKRNDKYEVCLSMRTIMWLQIFTIFANIVNQCGSQMLYPILYPTLFGDFNKHLWQV